MNQPLQFSLGLLPLGTLNTLFTEGYLLLTGEMNTGRHPGCHRPGHKWSASAAQHGHPQIKWTKRVSKSKPTGNRYTGSDYLSVIQGLNKAFFEQIQVVVRPNPVFIQTFLFRWHRRLRSGGESITWPVSLYCVMLGANDRTGGGKG